MLPLNSQAPCISIDEAGRGCLAGPVSIGLVHFSKTNQDLLESGTLLPGVRDSKKLSPQRRIELYKSIVNLAHWWLVVLVSSKRIDSSGINPAIFYGIEKGIHKSRLPKPYLLVDGNYKLPTHLEIAGYQSIVRGDDKVKSIACASILAKVTRDRFMESLDQKLPGYGFSENKGYGTEFHRNRIEKMGFSRQHRLSFCSNLRSTEHANLPFLANS